MSKYTPGPWEFRPYYRGIQAANGRQVARTPEHPGENGPGRWKDLTGQDEANGQLIAAAPDLLRCLRDYRRECPCTENALCHLCTEAGFALERAEGR